MHVSYVCRQLCVSAYVHLFLVHVAYPQNNLTPERCVVSDPKQLSSIHTENVCLFLCEEISVSVVWFLGRVWLEMLGPIL